MYLLLGGTLNVGGLNVLIKDLKLGVGRMDDSSKGGLTQFWNLFTVIPIIGRNVFIKFLQRTHQKRSLPNLHAVDFISQESVHLAY